MHTSARNQSLHFEPETTVVLTRTPSHPKSAIEQKELSAVISKIEKALSPEEEKQLALINESIKEKKFDAAITLSSEALEKNALCVPILKARALAYLLSGKKEESASVNETWKIYLKVLENSLKLHAAKYSIDVVLSAAQQLFLGRMALDDNQYDEAIFYFSAALNRCDEIDDAVYYRAHCYLETKKVDHYPSAMADLKRISLIDKDEPRYFYLLGKFYLLLNDIEKACEAYFAGMKLNPGKSVLNDVGERKEVLSFIAEYFNPLELLPLPKKCSGNFFAEFQRNKRAKQYTAAINFLNHAIKEDEINPIAYFERGVIHEELKEYEEALCDLTIAIWQLSVFEPKRTYYQALYFVRRRNLYIELGDLEGCLSDHDMVCRIEEENFKQGRNQNNEMKRPEQHHLECAKALLNRARRFKNEDNLKLAIRFLLCARDIFPKNENDQKTKNMIDAEIEKMTGQKSQPESKKPDLPKVSESKKEVLKRPSTVVVKVKEEKPKVKQEQPKGKSPIALMAEAMEKEKNEVKIFSKKPEKKTPRTRIRTKPKAVASESPNKESISKLAQDLSVGTQEFKEHKIILPSAREVVLTPEQQKMREIKIAERQQREAAERNLMVIAEQERDKELEQLREAKERELMAFAEESRNKEMKKQNRWIAENLSKEIEEKYAKFEKAIQDARKMEMKVSADFPVVGHVKLEPLEENYLLFLESQGAKAYLFGCGIMKKPSSDKRGAVIDFVTTASSEIISQIPNGVVNENLSLFRVNHLDGVKVNFLQSKVLAHSLLTEAGAFTVEQLYADRHGNVFDPTGRGLSDFNKKIIASVKKPSQMYSEDPLKMLHALMLCQKYGFRLHADDEKVIASKSIYFGSAEQKSVACDPVRFNAWMASQLCEEDCGEKFLAMLNGGIFEKLFDVEMISYLKKSSGWICQQLAEKEHLKLQDVYLIFITVFMKLNAQATLKKVLQENPLFSALFPEMNSDLLTRYRALGQRWDAGMVFVSAGVHGFFYTQPVIAREGVYSQASHLSERRVS